MLEKLLLMLFSGIFLATVQANEKNSIKNDTDRISYSLGYQIGRDFKRQNVKPSSNALMQGILDATTEKQPTVSPIEMYSLLVAMKKQIQATEIKEKKQKVYLYRKQGREFLAENAKKKDVVTLPGGLQYRVIRQGKGKMPKATDIVSINYRGATIDGREFDSSYREGKPAQFKIENLIPGLSEALQKMQEGAVWQLFIPSHLGYRSRGPLANQVLIYDVELIAVNEASEQSIKNGE
jgi:FKBP-type peptidyl-prolyl cis-trans isomerase FklB